jgi:GMP synthase-like glutamine amidotransferase
MTARKRVVILQHVPNENAGTILTFLNKKNMPYNTVYLYEKNYAFPNLNSVSSVVVMGGPMNVYEEDKYPFLREENKFIKEVVKNNIPYLGICLGAQLFAKSLGAKVYKGLQPEIGWDKVNLSNEAVTCNLFQGLGQRKSLKVLQWHEDTFDLPQGSVHLASSRVVPNQAFCYKNIFHGLQFHLEVNRAMLEDWFKGTERLEDIVREHDSYRTELEKITSQLYGNFFEFH